MYPPLIISEPAYLDNIPVIDKEFDRFEVNSDLEIQLREAETANFYHDAIDPEE